MLSQVEPGSLRGGGDAEEDTWEEEDEGPEGESATARMKRLKKAEKARKKAARKAERKAEKAEKDAEKARKKAEKKVAKQKVLDERVARLSGLFGWGDGSR